MKRLLLVIALCLSCKMASAQKDSLVTVFWNLENFFDYFDKGGGESDAQFSSYGARRWTKKRFYAKCDAVAKSLFFIGDMYGKMPDVIGFAEIENKWVLRKLVETTSLRKYGYEIVHFDSRDRRGIDVALLYRSSQFNLKSTSLRLPLHEGIELQTRDILHVCLKKPKNGCFLDFIVNHHPSKFGGSVESENRRNSAMVALKELCDSLYSSGSDKIIAMGDFNDTPDAPAFDVISPVLVNKAVCLYERGEGTIRYEGKWDLIDMFLVSPDMDKGSRMEICRIPFLMTREKKHPGVKPLRTYSGPRYNGGVSDHCPIVLLYSE